MAEIKTLRAYRSCFIADVTVRNDVIVLQDTAKNFFFIDIKDSEAVKSFKEWFRTVFLRGIAQNTSIFTYEKVDDCQGAYDLYIKKFIMKSDNADMLEVEV